MAEPKKHFLLNIRGQDPLQSDTPVYSNFVSVSRLGTDVQLEFIFVDINQLAVLAETLKSDPSTPREVVGKTIAKIVMPGENFLQIREHLNVLFNALSELLHPSEVSQ
jgi:hypothetical protein